MDITGAVIDNKMCIRDREITDKIKITLSKNQQTDDAVNEYKDYICNQVLGPPLTLTDEVENGRDLNFDDFSLSVSVVKE